MSAADRRQKKKPPPLIGTKAHFRGTTLVQCKALRSSRVTDGAAGDWPELPGEPNGGGTGRFQQRAPLWRSAGPVIFPFTAVAMITENEFIINSENVNPPPS